MQTNTDAIIRLELKYCEQCGGLWLRVEKTKQSYCGDCARKVRELPARKLDNRRSEGSGPKLRQARRAAVHREFTPAEGTIVQGVQVSAVEVVQ
jgi:hypothetical protein